MQGQQPQPLPAQQTPPLPGSAAQPRQTVGCVTRTTCLTLVGIAVGIALVLLVAGICSSMATSGTTGTTGPSSPAAQPSPAAPAGPAVNHTVLSLKGTGYETTQPFRVPSSEWLLSWTLTGDPQYADVTFFVYSSSGDEIDSIDAKPGSGSATIHQGDDVFFMEILDAKAAYTVTVTAKYPGPDQTYTVPPLTRLTTIKGSGDKSSPTFHVSGSIWAMVIQTGAPTRYTSVTAYIYRASDNSQLSEASVEGARGGSRTISYVHSGPGDYYVKVLSAKYDLVRHSRTEQFLTDRQTLVYGLLGRSIRRGALPGADRLAQNEWY
jgi:hypothetical protein